MSDDLVVKESSDLQNLEVTAASAAAMPHMQEQLALWARRKLELVRQELTDFEEVERKAFEKGYKTAAHTRLRLKSQKRVVFYEKVLAALDAGFCLFPVMAAEIFAVRTCRERPTWNRHEQKVNSRTVPVFTEPTKALPASKGEYVAPTVQAGARGSTSMPEYQKGEIVQVPGEWFAPSEEFDDIEFPLEMARPKVIDVTDDAMKLKIFDEIGILPPRWNRNADPVIVGNILHPSGRKLSFLIAWHINTRDL